MLALPRFRFCFVDVGVDVAVGPELGVAVVAGAALTVDDVVTTGVAETEVAEVVVVVVAVVADVVVVEAVEAESAVAVAEV